MNFYLFAQTPWALGVYLSGYPIFLGIERSKDSSGADTGAGLVVAYGYYGDPNLLYIPFSGAYKPPSTRLNCILSSNSAFQGTSNIYLGLVYPLNGNTALPAITNFIIMKNSDVPAPPVQIGCSVYGTTRTYLCLGSLFTNLLGASDSIYTLCPLYE
jgi:hypothetical protein